MTTQEILALPMDGNDANAQTIEQYLGALLLRIWDEGEGFSGKRPFGNSGWHNELYTALVKGRAISGTFDEDGWLLTADEPEADRLIGQCIVERFGLPQKE